MPNKVKVTMLGTSATGKTCYMVAMCSMMGIACRREEGGLGGGGDRKEEGQEGGSKYLKCP